MKRILLILTVIFSSFSPLMGGAAAVLQPETTLGNNKFKQTHPAELDIRIKVFVDFVLTTEVNDKKLEQQTKQFVTATIKQFSTTKTKNRFQLQLMQLIDATRAALLEERDRLIQQEPELSEWGEHDENQEAITRIDKVLTVLDTYAIKKKPWYKRHAKKLLAGAGLIGVAMLLWYMKQNAQSYEKKKKKVYYFVAGTDKEIKVYNGATGTVVSGPTVQGKGNFVIWSPTGKLFAYEVRDGLIGLYNIDGIKITENIEGSLGAFGWSPTGKFFSTGTHGVTRVYKADGTQVGHDIESNAWFTRWSRTRDFFTAGTSEVARLYKVDGTQVLDDIQGNFGRVKWPQRGIFFTAGTSEITRLYKVGGVQIGEDIQGDAATVNWSPTGEFFTAGTNVVRLYNTEGIQIGRDIQASGYYLGSRYAVEWSPTGDFFTTGSKDVTRLYKADGTQVGNEIMGIPSFVKWSPRGDIFTAGLKGYSDTGTRATTRIYNTSGAQVGTDTDGDPESVFWSKTGDYFMTGSDEVERFYKADSTHIRNYDKGYYTNFRWSPYDNYFTKRTRKEIQLYDVKTDKPMWKEPVRGENSGANWSP